MQPAHDPDGQNASRRPMERRREVVDRSDSGLVGELLKRSPNMPVLGPLSFDLNDKKGPSPLWIACSEGDLERVQKLLKSRANVEEMDALSGLTPLGIASQHGHLDVLAALLKAGADVEAPNPATGATPLFAAVAGGHEEAVAALLEAGADANAADSFRWTPLHAAAEKGLLQTVKQLVKGGADVGAVDSGNKTPVQMASRHGHEDVVHALLDAGARYPAGVKGALFVESWLLQQPDNSEARAECSRRLYGILLYNGASMQRIASLPLVRDAVQEILQQHRPASLIVLDGIVLVVMAIMYMRTSWAVQHEGTLTSSDIQILIVMWCCAVYMLLREATQSYVMSQVGELSTQASSIWNWIDLGSAFAAVALGIMTLCGESVRLSATFRLVAAFGAFPIWAKFLGYIKALNLKFATFVMAFFQIARDLRSFVVILLIILLAFANVLFVVLHPRADRRFGDDEAEEPFSSVQETMLTSYRMLLGDFEREWFAVPDDDASRRVAVLVFVLYLFVMNVLLLNVLIAVVSDSYDYSMTRSFGLYNRARLELAVELQAVFSLALTDGDDGNHNHKLRDALSVLLSNKVMAMLGSERVKGILERRPYTGRALVCVLGGCLFCVLSPVVLLDLSTWLFLTLTSYNPSLADVDDDDEWQGRAVDMENRVRKVVDPFWGRITDTETLLDRRILRTGQTLDDKLVSMEAALNARVSQVEADFREQLRSTRETLERKVLEVHASMKDKIGQLGRAVDLSIVEGREESARMLTQMDRKVAQHFQETDVHVAQVVERSDAAVEQRLRAVQTDLLGSIAALETAIQDQVLSRLDTLVHREFVR
eukprot:scaffold1149_cov236-Pinguiococcus_pyrenoidosus.AAC.13